MTKSVLKIEHSGDAYYLVWHEDQTVALGEAFTDGKGTPPANLLEWEHWQATRSVMNCADGRDSKGLCWRTSEGANKALRKARAALRGPERPLPEWAVTALANGFKAPKGWHQDE